MKRIAPLVVLGALLCAPRLHADELLYGYEGDVMPLDAGWYVTNACDGNCSEFVNEEGCFVATWPVEGDRYSYARIFAQAPVDPPPTLWIEWHFRSNFPLGPIFDACDARMSLLYRDIHDSVEMYGDAAIRFGGFDRVTGLDLPAFHSYRFESRDGIHYTVAVDGTVFVDDQDDGHWPVHLVDFGGRGGCLGDWIPNMTNEWDFIRYGTVGFGERIIAVEPAAGFLDPPANINVTRFTATFEAPNYAHVDDITVEVTCDSSPECPEPPIVIATKRLDNGPPEVLQVMLDRPLPPGERTTFTFRENNPNAPDVLNTVAYTFQRGDVNADGRWNLRDFAALQNCFYTLAATNTCAAVDYDRSLLVDASDYASFEEDFSTQGP